MARKITCQDPVVVPAKAEATYDEMVITSFRVTRNQDGTLRLRASLDASDAEGNLNPEGRGFNVKINDLDNQMAVTPKLKAAWDSLVDVMGLAYDFYRLREKVEQAIAKGEDAEELIEARNAALAQLREPI